MPDIINYLNQIRTAVYGRDVRDAIANGITQCYQDTSNGVTLAETKIGELDEAIEQISDLVGQADEAVGTANGVVARADELNTALSNNAKDLVLVQNAQPDKEFNKVWVKPQVDEVEVPTYEEFSDLKSAFVNATQYTTNYIEGYYVARDGELVADSDCSVSEMIPIVAMSPRSCAFYFGESNGTKMNLVIYGEDGTFLDYWGSTSGESRSISNIPTTAKYARFSFKRGYKGKLTSSNGFVYWEANEFNTLSTATVGYATKNRNNTNNGAMGSTAIVLEQNSIKNPSIVFYGKIGTFDSLKIGVGSDDTYTEYLEIDSDNITFHVGTSTGSSIPHGLTISEYLSVIINIKSNCDYTIILNSLGGIYTRDMVYPNPWIGNKGSIFAQAGSANTFTTYRLTYSADFNKTKWLFGDSYITNYSDARWPYYVQSWGYDNTLLNGYPGEDSNDAFQDFLALIQHGSPKYVVWCMGMNDPDSSAINADWLRCVQNVISICQRRGIEPILATIPNVPNVLHTYKNAWIKNDSGCRYIDFAEAVGAESANSTWYTGCLEEGSSRIHPTVDGARLLAARALTDFPEFMQK